MQKFIEKLQEKFPEIKFRNAIYYKSKHTLSIECVFLRYLEDSEKQSIKDALLGIMPSIVKHLEVEYKRCYIDEDMILRYCSKFIKQNYSMLAVKISEQCYDIDIGEDAYSIVLNVDSQTYKFCKKVNFLSQLLKSLQDNFIGTFVCNINDCGAWIDHELILSETLEKQKKLQTISGLDIINTIPVTNKTPLVGGIITNDARYIRDIKSEMGRVALCGKVYGVEYLQSEPPFIQFKLKDQTGTIPCKIYVRDTNVQKLVDSIIEDCTIIGFGKTRLNAEREYVFIIHAVNFCQISEDFVPTKKQSRPPNDEYLVAQPKDISMSEQVYLLDESTKYRPKSLQGKRVVIFGVCTTGGDPMYTSIIKVGGLSIENGAISQMFSSFVDPKIPISHEVTRMTGINDSIVRGQPQIDVVIHDIYKFFCGATLIGYKGEVMIKYLQRFGEQNGYIFDNKILDISEEAKMRNLGLSNYKTRTVCEYFGIPVDNWDRTYGDLIAMAQIYIRLCKMDDV